MNRLEFRGMYIFIGLALVLTGACSRDSGAGATDSAMGNDPSVFVRSHSPTLGSADAKVNLIEFFDPACETCAVFAPFVKTLMANNPGKIRLVLRYAPFHQGSDYFVKILEASKNQNKYWETLNVLFKYQSDWASHHRPQPEKIWKYLPEAELDIDQLRQDMQDSAILDIIKQDLADAKTLKVSKTPGFFANGRPLESFGYQQLQTLIESELKVQYP